MNYVESFSLIIITLYGLLCIKFKHWLRFVHSCAESCFIEHDAHFRGCHTFDRLQFKYIELMRTYLQQKNMTYIKCWNALQIDEFTFLNKLPHI